MKLADELCRKGNPAAAIPLYQKCLDGPFADNPDIHLRLAMAAFDAGKPGETVTVLDQLIAQNSDYRSQDAHLLYARALEALGNDQRAAQEYENLCGYFSGPEAKCRYGLFLKSHGRGDEARQQFRDVLQGAKHAQPHVRKRHREWIDLARGETG